MRNNNERTDDITIEEEAMEQEVRPKLELGHLVPDFTLQTVDGKTISVREYKEKKNLVLYFFDIHNRQHWEALAEIRRRYNDFADSNAEVLAISSGPMNELVECTSSMKLQFPLLCDCAREATCAYCVSDAMIFVADKFGELKYESEVSDKKVDEIMDEVTSTLELIELECPECGVPTWPQFK